MDRNRHEERFAQGSDFIQKIREARRVAQPAIVSPSITDIPYRAISIYPSVLLAHLGITPNQITLLWILIGMVAVVALGSPSYAFRISGAILLQMSYLLDYVDGEVSRLQRRTSKRGFFLDLAGHGLIKSALFLAVGYQVAGRLHQPAALLLSFSAAVCLVTGYAIPFYAAYASVRNEPVAAAHEVPSTRIGTVRKLFNVTGLLFESPGLYAALLLGTILDAPQWVILFYGIFSPIWFLRRLCRYRFE